MEKIMKYEEPELTIIYMTQSDIITASGDGFEDNEGEMVRYLLKKITH